MSDREKEDKLGERLFAYLTSTFYYRFRKKLGFPYGKLEIASGDLSYLLPPESSNVSLPDNLTMEPNVSKIVPHLDKRQLFLFTQASQPIKLSSDRYELRDNAKRCTLGFAVRRGGWDPFDHAFLTLGSCMSTDQVGNINGAFFIHPFLGAVRIGTARTSISDFVYRRFFGLNFVPVRLIPDNPPYRIFWNDLFSTQLTIPINPNNPGQRILADVVGDAFLPDVGERVCATTGYSNYYMRNSYWNFCPTINA